MAKRLVTVLVALSGVREALGGCLQLATPNTAGTTGATSVVMATCPNALRSIGDCFGATETAWKERFTALSNAFGGTCAMDFLCGYGLNCYGNATCQGVSATIPPRLCCAAFERCGKTQITLPNGITVGRGEFCKQLGDTCQVCAAGQVLCASSGCIDPTTTTCADGPVLSKPVSGAGNTGETLRREVIATCRLNDSSTPLFDTTTGQPVAGALDTLRTKLANLPYNCACVVQKALKTLQQLAITTDPFINVLNTLAQAGQCTLNTDQAQQEITKVRKACPAPFIFSEVDNTCITPQPVNGACPEPLVLSQSGNSSTCTIPAARTVNNVKVCSPPLVANSNGGCSSPPTINPNARAGRCPSGSSSGTTCTADQDCSSPMKCCNGNCATPVAPTPPANGVTLPAISDSTRTCIMLKNVGEVVSTTSDAPVSTLSTMCQPTLPAQTTTPAPPHHPCQEYASRCTSSSNSAATDFKTCFANLLSTNVIPTGTFCAKWIRNNANTDPCSTYVDDASKCKKDTPSATFECLKANFASLPANCQQKVQTVIDDMPCDSYFSKYCSSYTKLYDKVNCLRAVIDASADASIVSQTCQTLLSFSAACSWERVSLCQDSAPNADSIRSCLLAVPTAQLSTSCASLVATIKQNEPTISNTASRFAAQQSSTDIGCGTSSGVVQNSCTSISGSTAGVTTTTSTPSTPSTGTTPPKVSAAASSAPMYILAVLAMAFAVLF